MSAYRIGRALGHSNKPPARIGRIIRPGENHDADTCTAPTPMTTTVSARIAATRRFRVMNCRLIRPRNDCGAAKIADPVRRPELETMMAKTVPGQDLSASGQARHLCRWPAI